MKKLSIEEQLRKYMDRKYEQNNITSLLNMIHGLIEENNSLKERLAIIEQILHMHLPIIEKD